MTSKKLYNAEDVAQYFIYLASNKIIGDHQEREGITNLKLQKILYLAQAYYLVKFNKPLFKDDIKAWIYGPVIPSVYNKYKKYKNSPIINEKDKALIGEEDKAYLREVWDTFGGYSASRLVDITHSHAPWEKAYNSPNKNISNQSIKAYYSPLLNS